MLRLMGKCILIGLAFLFECFGRIFHAIGSFLLDIAIMVLSTMQKES